MSLRSRSLLLDLQGVLYQEGAVIEGAGAALATLQAAGIGIRYLTNTTTRPRAEIARRMRAMGFEVADEDVVSPAVAARGVLAERGLRRVHLAADPGLAEDLAGFELVERAPDAVVLGDLHTGFTWERLNGLFAMIRDGALLVALHRNRQCVRDGELALDLGPFVAALEFAARVEAIVVGKPAGPFFAMALAGLGAGPGETAMVGDDIDSDIAGAARAGLETVQVRTGKYTTADDTAEVQPDLRLDSIADLPAVLGL